MLLNTFSHCKREQNCEEPKWLSQSALLWPLAGAEISCLNPKSHWFLASTHSTFNPIGSCNRNLNTQCHRDTYAHTTTYQRKTNKNRILSTVSTLIKRGVYRIQVIFSLRGRFHFPSLTPTTQAK